MKTEEKKKVAGRSNCIKAFLMSGVLAVTSCLSIPQAAQMVEAAADTEIQNPRVEVNTCDTVYFGSYWQENTNGDRKADENDEKQPIRWRILSRNGNDAYVIADNVLDCKKYNETSTGVTWETCTLRTWLNGEFLNSAFTAEEQTAIIEQTLVNNADNEEYRTEGGNDTKDKVYLPSITDMKNTAYGFSGDSSFYDQERIGKVTDYAYDKKLYATEDMGTWWWLRSGGCGARSAAIAEGMGSIDMTGADCCSMNVGVRPVMHINLSSPSVKKGEKVQTSLKSATWDLVELGTYNGEPIVWRVLAAEGDDVYLLSEKVLENRAYNEERGDITWKDSTLRTWLNGEFYQTAFNETEKIGITKHIYENKNNPWDGTKGGENTEDFVTVLSVEDIVNEKYGFPTDYLCAHHGRSTGKETGWWWLRTRSYDTFAHDYVNALSVWNNGLVNTDPDGKYVDDVGGIRPVLYFNTSSSFLKKVGTITEIKNPEECTEHTEETIAAVQATCETEGKTEGVHCAVCGKVLKEQESVAATGHTEETDEAVQATCEAEGKTEGKHCAVCGKVLKEQESVAATGHTEETDEAVQATCEAEGKTEGKHCAVCGKVLKEQETVAATGHTEETDEAVQATCEAEGKTEGKHCAVCGKVLKEQETVAAAGHKWDSGTVAKQPTSTEDGEKIYTCTVCGKTKTEKIKATGTDKPTESDKPDITKPSVPSIPGAQTDATVKLQSVKLSGETKKMAAGKKTKLTAIVAPDNATYKTLSWESSNTKYATVDSNGKVTAKAKGAGKTVTITATAKDGSGVKATYRIKVMKDAVKSINLSKAPESVKAGKSVKLKTVVKTTGKKVNKTLSWESSNKKYATVTKKGVVKTKKTGKGKTVKITVRSTDGSNKKVSVKLKIK